MVNTPHLKPKHRFFRVWATIANDRHNVLEKGLYAVDTAAAIAGAMQTFLACTSQEDIRVIQCCEVLS